MPATTSAAAVNPFGAMCTLNNQDPMFQRCYKGMMGRSRRRGTAGRRVWNEEMSITELETIDAEFFCIVCRGLDEGCDETACLGLDHD